MNKKRYKKSQVLKGVKVIDFAEVWAGPFGASLMGDMGADVRVIWGRSCVILV